MNKRDDNVQAPEARSESQMVRARQHSRARVMAVLLFAFVALVFAISVVKISQGYAT